MCVCVWVSNSFMSEVSILILIRNLDSWVLKFDVIWDQSSVSTAYIYIYMASERRSPKPQCTLPFCQIVVLVMG